jgi:hypothetical protein
MKPITCVLWALGLDRRVAAEVGGWRQRQAVDPLEGKSGKAQQRANNIANALFQVDG